MSANATTTLILTDIGGNKVNLGTALDTTKVFIRTKGLDLGRDDVVKFIDRILYNVSERVEQTNLKLKIYGSDDEDGPYELLDTIDISQKDPGYTDPPGKRFYKLEFIDDPVQERWRLHGFSFFGELGGDVF